uniref:Uncharacterized protein n=1 Tax=Mastacembelus armatus TaxID=205130 RepID=A0A3Q3L8F5_9TELE
KCTCGSDALMKALSQEPQLNGRSPRCCRSWSFRWDLCLKAFSHIWQAKEWIFRCSLRCAAVVKALGQCSQRSPSHGCEDLYPCWCCSCAAETRESRLAPCYPSPDHRSCSSSPPPWPAPSGWRPELSSRGRLEPGSPGSSCWSAHVSECTGYPGS